MATQISAGSTMLSKSCQIPQHSSPPEELSAEVKILISYMRQIAFTDK
jgi:hypothetical protein